MANRDRDAGLIEQTDVIICGGGPTGALLSAYLGKMDVSSILIEKEHDIVTDPRGIALDEDGIRTLQSLGLYDKVYSDIGAHMGWLHFISGKDGLRTKPFVKVHLSTSDGSSGHVGAIAHKQPVLEKWIRSAASQCSKSQLRWGCTLESIEEDDDNVRVVYVDTKGEKKRIQGKFLVGADGKTGYVRKNYLEPRGIKLESVAGYEYQETWVAANYHMTLPTTESHPDFPLWKLGYTPEQVYDAFFPTNFRFIGNPTRPAVCGTFGRRAERLWRFEFVVQDGEDAQAMASYDQSTKIIFPYLTHPGHLYGLKNPVQFPPDCVEVLRSRPFSFSARSCNRWNLDRVILCGDAAHVMPPFGGQGIASGFRDVTGISWRLALACRPSSKLNYKALFDGWCLERKQSLDSSIANTVANGSLTTARNPIKIFCRDWILWLMQLIPSVRRQLELGPRGTALAKYTWSSGMNAFLPDLGGGLFLPQVYCRAVSGPLGGNNGEVLFTDDAIYAGSWTSVLRLVILVDRVEEISGIQDELNKVNLPMSTQGILEAQQPCFLVHDPNASLSSALEDQLIKSKTRDRVFRVATGAEFASSKLCADRPDPQGYDMFRIRTSLKGRRFIVVRTDRFIALSTKSVQDLVKGCDRLLQTLGYGREGEMNGSVSPSL